MVSIYPYASQAPLYRGVAHAKGAQKLMHTGMKKSWSGAKQKGPPFPASLVVFLGGKKLT
ncbi:hypothetical protein [Novosphingobium sp. KACC 22771]|uniref:hypothetical protein n=1 Tax=Novosphingobium sp. KACC 22771 TaxID=3025670 RepID=UPI00236700DE|nr:hypothetical protein [Novosphingobium sp. KACC 22771]WDF71568.1 hypothetical protein PQ467_12235 [Novosphingobium sp. KACC 22771]